MSRRRRVTDRVRCACGRTLADVRETWQPEFFGPDIAPDRSRLEPVTFYSHRQPVREWSPPDNAFAHTTFTWQCKCGTSTRRSELTPTG